MSTAFQVDPDALTRYRQDVLNVVSKWSSSGSGNLQMILAANATRQLRRCVLCGCEEPPSSSGSSSSSYSQISNSPGSRRMLHSVAASPSGGNNNRQPQLPVLDQLIQEFYDHGWFRYDTLDHCFCCAKRLAGEILVPHVEAAKRDATVAILKRILDEERSEGAAAAAAAAAGNDYRSVSPSTDLAVGEASSAALDAAAKKATKTTTTTITWQCACCGADNTETVLGDGSSNNSSSTSATTPAPKCSVCDVERPPPLICPYCNKDATNEEFCPNDPVDPMEHHLTYSHSDPLLSSGGGPSRSFFSSHHHHHRHPSSPSAYSTSSSAYGSNGNSNRSVGGSGGGADSKANSRHGRHDTWSCESQRCRTLNLGIVHPDRCRACASARMWHCVTCKHRYASPSTYCPKCFGRARAGSAAELEELELCKLTNMTVEQARRQRRSVALLDGAKLRVRKRIESKMGMVNVKAEDDGNCLFHALSFQLFRHSGLHHLLRLLAVEHIILEKEQYLPFVHGSEASDASDFRADGSSISRSANAGGESSPQRSECLFADYATRMSRDRTWGDALVLHAIACVFNVQIHIISGAREHWHNIIHSGHGDGSGGAENSDSAGAAAATNTTKHVIFISFIAELHYNSIVLHQSDATNQSFPYRRWVEFGDLNVNSLIGGGGGGGGGSSSSSFAASSLCGPSSTVPSPSSLSNGTSATANFGPLPTELPNATTTTTTVVTSTNNSGMVSRATSSNNNDDDQQPQTPSLVLPALVSVSTVPTTTSIKKNEPFDRVTIFFPDAEGEPGGFLGFNAENGRMEISKEQPSFFQRFPAETPQITRTAFPQKSSGAQSFILMDELGKKIICGLLPMMLGSSHFAQQSVSNEPAALSLETVQRTQAREPRCTVTTSFRDGSCCIGPWLFVVDWRGKQACIVMETPSKCAKPPARIDFLDERLLHQCTACGKFYTVKENGSGKRHVCAAMMQQMNNFRR